MGTVCIDCSVTQVEVNSQTLPSLSVRTKKMRTCEETHLYAEPGPDVLGPLNEHVKSRKWPKKKRAGVVESLLKARRARAASAGPKRSSMSAAKAEW